MATVSILPRIPRNPPPLDGPGSGPSLAVVLADFSSHERKHFRQDLAFSVRIARTIEQTAAAGASDPDSCRLFEDTIAFALLKLRRLRQAVRRARRAGEVVEVPA